MHLHFSKRTYSTGTSFYAPLCRTTTAFARDLFPSSHVNFSLVCSERYKNIATPEFSHKENTFFRTYVCHKDVLLLCPFRIYDAECRQHRQRYTVLAMCIKEENIFRNNFRQLECYIITTMYLTFVLKSFAVHIINTSTVTHKLYL